MRDGRGCRKKKGVTKEDLLLVMRWLLQKGHETEFATLLTLARMEETAGCWHKKEKEK